MTLIRLRTTTIIASAALCVLSMPAGVAAREEVRAHFSQPSQSMADALRQLGVVSGWEVLFVADDVAGLTAPALTGDMAPGDAVQKLLAGSGLSAKISGKSIIIKRRATAENTASDAMDIVITGSHIRGAAPSAPVRSISQEEMKNAGQIDLGEVIRTIPQNFNGGQNPGIAAGAGIRNQNVNSASSLNLRGLGPDATLTLLNGHRLPYDSGFAGVDISAIPLSAVDRLEIVADGASALYGSDAVGGVANVILRTDFDGLDASGQVGASTEGGNVAQQFGLVGGKTWADGGIMLAYDFQRNSAISARERNYTRSLPDDSTLYPYQRRHAFLLSGHQQLSETLEFAVDALYNKRWSTTFSAPALGDGFTYDALRFTPTGETYSIAPSLRLRLANQWLVTAQFFYGRDNTRFDTTDFPGGATPVRTQGCYCNDAWSAELNAEGAVAHLPGGDIRLAVGGGYRFNGMHYSVATDGLVQSAFKPSRDSFYGYGEFHIPVIGEEQELSWIHALSVTGALRYEKYPGIDQIATPKLGLVLAPTEDFAVKASWGRSFKTPTLYQQYVGQEAYLFSAADFGTDVPAGSSLFYVSGGNRDLKPEKARSWSTTISVHPSQLQGLKVEASYFNIDFTNRVVQPVAGSLGGILDKPAYADLLTFAPDAGTLDAIAAGSLYGLTNFSDGEYDPSRVVALVDNRYRNVARQTIKGVDLSVSYRLDLADQQSLSFSGFGSYLQSHQRLTDSLPALQLAGTVFNPPHVRARGGLTWETRKSDISGFASYTGPVDDARPEQKTRVGPALTFDLVGRWNVGGPALAKGGVDITLSILNVLDDRPDTIFTTGPTDTPYDSTNYSPIGRFVALALSKRW